MTTRNYNRPAGRMAYIISRKALKRALELALAEIPHGDWRASKEDRAFRTLAQIIANVERREGEPEVVV